MNATWSPPVKKHIWHWAEIPQDPVVKKLMPEIDLQYVITEHNVPDNATACWNHSIFPPGSQHHKHYHKYADEVAYVVRGRCVLGLTIDGVDVEFVAGPGTAVWAKRGQPHWHRNPFSEPVEFVGAYFGVPSVEKSGYVDLREEKGKPTDKPMESLLYESPTKKYIWHWAEIPQDPKVKELMPEIDLQYVITEHTVPDNKTACWNHSIFPPGSQHHKHYHKYADEVAYVVRGQCIVGLTINGVDVEFVVGPGTAVWAKRGQPHWHRNPFDEPVEFVGAYFGAPSVEKSGYVDLREKSTR